MKSFFISIITLLLSTFTAQGVDDEVITTLLVTPEGGEQIQLCLDSRPTVSFTDSEILIATETQVLSFSLASKVECTFSTERAGIALPESDATVSVRLQGKSVCISGLTEGYGVYVYNLSGTALYQGVAYAGGSVTIDLSQFPTGIYILKSNKLSYKFILK